MRMRRRLARRASPTQGPGWQSVMRGMLDESAQTLSAADAHAMRGIVVAAARDNVRERIWTRPLAIAATVAVIVGAGAAAARRFEPPPAASAILDEQVHPDANAPRQLQFATPGGTRIIWVFNPDLDLKATMP